MRSGSSPCHFSACVVAQLLLPLERPPARFRCLLDEQLTRLCAGYARKYEALTSALSEHSMLLLAEDAGGALQIEGSPGRRVGGYFVWVLLPPWCRGNSVALSFFQQAVSAAGLTVRAGEECTGNGTGNQGYIRLCFAR